MRTEQDRRTQQAERINLDQIEFVVAPREFPFKVGQEVRRKQGNRCQGIDDKHGLDICVFEIIGIDGKHIPASADLGFNIDISHYTHNKNLPLYYTEEAVRCQCIGCHGMYTQGIGHFSSLKKINKRDVYSPNAKTLSAKQNIRLDPTLRRAAIVRDVLTQKLYEAGVAWEYGKEVVFTRGWNGVGTQEQIIDIARRLYAPKPIDQMIWDMDQRKQQLEIKGKDQGVIYEAKAPIDWAEYHGIR